MILKTILLTVLAVAPAGGEMMAQGNSISEQARVASQAWQAHDIRLLVKGSNGVQVNLPGAEPSVALAEAQAIATLRTFVSRTEELRVTVTAARAVGAGHAYVELGRSYRVRGTQEDLSQRVLLGYRLVNRRWVLTEVRVLE